MLVMSVYTGRNFTKKSSDICPPKILVHHSKCYFCSLKHFMVCFCTFSSLFFRLLVLRQSGKTRELGGLVLAGPDMVCRAQEMIRHAWAWLCFLEVWNMGLGDNRKGLWAPHSSQRIPWNLDIEVGHIYIV